MQKLINSFLKLIKYPGAICSVVFAYPLFLGLIHLIGETFSMRLAIYFLLPIAGTAVLWYVIPGLAGSPLTIFAHEATHMLAAVLTFHKPTGMNIVEDKGGSFSYAGKGNWFITIAPYFVPTFPLIWMIVGLFLKQPFETWYIFSYGFLVGFHISANLTQMHVQQPDFKKAGWIFTILFIPSANMLCAGYLWCFALKGWSGLSLWNHYMATGTHESIKELSLWVHRLIG